MIEVIVPTELYMPTPDGDIVIETNRSMDGCKFGDKIQIKGREGHVLERYVLGVRRISHWYRPDSFSLVFKDGNPPSKDQNPSNLNNTKDYNPTDLKVLQNPESLIAFYNNLYVSERLGTIFVTTAKYVRGQTEKENALMKWLKNLLKNDQLGFETKKIYLAAFFAARKEIYKQKDYLDELGTISTESWTEHVKTTLLHTTKTLLSILCTQKPNREEVYELLIINRFLLRILNLTSPNNPFIEQVIRQYENDFNLSLISQNALALLIHIQSSLTEHQKKQLKQFTSLKLLYRKDLERRMRTPNLLYIETCDGSQIEVSTDCRSFYLKFGDRVNTIKGDGCVIGTTQSLNVPSKNKLWIKLDKNNFASPWQEFDSIPSSNTASLILKTTDTGSITHFFTVDGINDYLAKIIFQSFMHFLSPFDPLNPNLNGLLTWLYQIIADDDIADSKKMLHLKYLLDILKIIRASNATDVQQQPIYEDWRNAKTIEIYAFASGAIQSHFVSEKFNLKFILFLFNLLEKIEKSSFYTSIKKDMTILKTTFVDNIRYFIDHFPQELPSLLFTENNSTTTITIEELSDLVKMNYFISYYTFRTIDRPSIAQPVPKPRPFINPKVNDIYSTSYKSYSIQQQKYLDDLILTAITLILADKTLTAITRDQFDLIPSLVKYICLTSKQKQREMPAWYQVRMTELYSLCSETIQSQLSTEKFSIDIFLTLFAMLDTIEKSHFNTQISSIKELKASFINNIQKLTVIPLQELITQFLNQNISEDLIPLIKVNFYFCNYTNHDINRAETLRALVRKKKPLKNESETYEKPLSHGEAKVCIQKIKNIYQKYQDNFTPEQKLYLSDLVLAFPTPLISDQTKETRNWNKWSLSQPGTQPVQMVPIPEWNSNL